MLPCGFCFLDPLEGNVQRGDFSADPATEAVVQFHRIDVVAPVGHAAQLGDRKTVRHKNGDKETVRYTVDASVLTIGGENPGDAFFHTVSFCAG